MNDTPQLTTLIFFEGDYWTEGLEVIDEVAVKLTCEKGEVIIRWPTDLEKCRIYAEQWAIEQHMKDLKLKAEVEQLRLERAIAHRGREAGLFIETK